MALQRLTLPNKILLLISLYIDLTREKFKLNLR